MVCFVAEFKAPIACLHFLSSISVCVNGPPLGIRNGVHCLYKTNAAALASVVRLHFFVFFTVCSWSLYTSKYSAKLEAIKVSPPDLESQSLKIFVYHLPKRFNHDLLAKIKKDKKRYAGYQDQLAEATIYAELRRSPVHTKDPEEADLFSSLFLPPPAYHSLYINHNSENMRES